MFTSNLDTRYRHLLFVTIGLTLLPSSAFAQRFGSRTNSLMSIAANEAVQKELGVSGENAAQLSAINEAYRDASQRELTKLGIDYTAISDLPALERAAEMRNASEKAADVGRKLTSVYLPKIAEILDPQQVRRIKQIQLQASGIDVWNDPEIAKELDLTSDQQQKVTELRTEFSRRSQQVDGDFTQRLARIRELNAERDRRAWEVLSEQQRGKLEELKGTPFDVSQLGFRRRGNN